MKDTRLNHGTREERSTLLGELDALSALLESEFEALRTGEVGQLLEVSRRKSALIESLGQGEGWMSAARSNGETGHSSSELVQKLTELRSLNARNGLLISGSRHLTEQLLGALTGYRSEETLYGPAGADTVDRCRTLGRA